jgi:hypothetical protein
VEKYSAGMLGCLKVIHMHSVALCCLMVVCCIGPKIRGFKNQAEHDGFYGR